MRRRTFVTLLGSAVAAAPFTALAQQPSRIRRVAWLGLGRPDPQSPYVEALRAGTARADARPGPVAHMPIAA